MNHVEQTSMDDGAVVNHQAKRTFSIDDVGFFEGTEKLLEVWFSLSKRCYNTKGLREIPR